MAAERTSGIDFTGLEETFEWLKAKKNLLVGIALVAVLAWAAMNFIERQAHESKRAPWQAVLAAESQPWDATSDELAVMLADPRVTGTPAELYVRYWQALRKHEAGDSAGALELLAAFRRDFAASPMVTAKLPGSDLELRSAVDRMEAQIRDLQQWNAQHPLPTANPLPTGATVTLVTERGNIVIALHQDVAPKCSEAFLRVASQLKERFIAKTMPDKWIDVGVTEAGIAFDATDMAAVADGAPPFEQNTLSHFTGAVSFRQSPFPKATFNPDVRVMLGSDLNEDGRSTVFGQVIAGLDLLVAISKEARKPDNLLEKPVKITDVQVGVGAPPPEPPPGK